MCARFGATVVSMAQPDPAPSDVTPLGTWPGSAYPLGATYDGAGTNFSLFTEVADAVELCLVDKHGGDVDAAELLRRQANSLAAALVCEIVMTAMFLIVILGRQQLFTENTITVVLPVMASPTPRAGRFVIDIGGGSTEFARGGSERR